MGLVGKGVRARSSKGEAGLDTFAEGVLTFFFRSARELQTMRGFERTSNSLELGRDLPRFLGASLVAELLLAHALEEGDPELYDWISAVLARLGDAPAAEVPGWILAGAWRTLAHLGFAPGLTSCVGCGQAPAWGDGDLYRLDAASGRNPLSGLLGRARAPPGRAAGPRRPAEARPGRPALATSRRPGTSSLPGGFFQPSPGPHTPVSVLCAAPASRRDFRRGRGRSGKAGEKGGR